MKPQDSSRLHTGSPGPPARGRETPAQRRRPQAVPSAAAEGGGASGQGRHLPAPFVHGDRTAAGRLGTPAAARREARPRAVSGRTVGPTQLPPPRLLAARPPPLSRRGLLPPAGPRARCGRPLPLLRALRPCAAPARGGPCRAARFATGKRELPEGCGCPLSHTQHRNSARQNADSNCVCAVPAPPRLTFFYETPLHRCL